MNGHSNELLPGNWVIPLPEIDGHDMMPVPGSLQLILPTAAPTWFFDRTTHQFTKHPRLGDMPRVESVHLDTVSQCLMRIQVDGTTGWHDVLRFAHPETTIVDPLPASPAETSAPQRHGARAVGSQRILHQPYKPAGRKEQPEDGALPHAVVQRRHASAIPVPVAYGKG